MTSTKFQRVWDALIAKETIYGNLVSRKASLEAELERARQDNKEWTMLRDLIVETSNKVQLDVAERISSIVSLALSSTGFDYSFVIKFVQRRGTTEADLLFVKDGEELNPLTCSGGGALDIASFALRIAIWSLNKKSPVFILDEPFKHLSKDMQVACGQMMHALAEKFSLQIIMVSHNEEIISSADNLITIGK